MCLPLDCYDDVVDDDDDDDNNNDDDDDDDDDGAGGAGDGGDGSDGGDDEDLKDDDDDDDDDEEEEVDDDERIPTQSPILLPAARELIRRWSTSRGMQGGGGVEVRRARVLGDHRCRDDVDAGFSAIIVVAMMSMPTMAMRTSSFFRTFRCILIERGAGLRRGEGARPPPWQTTAADGLSTTTAAMAAGAVLHISLARPMFLLLLFAQMQRLILVLRRRLLSAVAYASGEAATSSHLPATPLHLFTS